VENYTIIVLLPIFEKQKIVKRGMRRRIRRSKTARAMLLTYLVSLSISTTLLTKQNKTRE